MKKQPAKKTAAKAAAKSTVKKAVAPKAAKAPAKKAPAKKAPAKKAGKKGKCGGSCGCGSDKSFCFETLISEIFNQLGDTQTLSELMKDYFFTELLKRGIDESVANALANKISVEIENFEANIDIIEDED